MSAQKRDEPITSWAIYIDMEGFGANYLRERRRVIAGLGCLMENLYWIGDRFCSERSKRLCVFQAGDGFFIDSEYGSPNVPIAIAVILMRSALLRGTLTKAGISEGECAGVSGWRPQVIRRNAKDDRVQIGSGTMYLFPVMGTAYISAHKLLKPRGALLLINADMAGRSSVSSVAIENYPDCKVIDWIHADVPEIRQIAEVANISIGEVSELEHCLRTEAREAASYFSSEKWLRHTLHYNRCEQSASSL